MRDSHTKRSVNTVVSIPKYLRPLDSARNYFNHWWKKNDSNFWVQKFYASMSGGLKRSTRSLKVMLHGSKHYFMHLLEGRIHHTELCYCFASLTVSLYYLLVTEMVNKTKLSNNVPI